MPDLNLSLDYFDHPKTRRLIGLLGRGAEVLPIRLWAYCGKHFAKDGRLADHSPQEIETIVEWWGKTGDAVEAMVKVGFIEADGSGHVVHDWTEHQGHIHAIRQRNKKVATNRWKNIENTAKSDVTVDTSGIPRGIPKSTSGVPQPTNQLTNQPIKPKENGAQFAPPSPDEVRQFAVEKGFVGFPHMKFVNFYESKGWMVGKTRMKNWKAAVMGWQDREEERGGSNGPGNARLGAPPVPGKYAHLSA